MRIHSHRFPVLRLAQSLALVLVLAGGLLIQGPEALARSSRARSGDSSAAASSTVSAAVTTRSDDGGNDRNRNISLSFKDMGAWGSIQLRGVDGTRYLSFPVRSDEVVVRARLRLAYDYSPALIPELSHLVVSLNGRVANVIGLPRDKPTGNTRDIDLDPRMFRDTNELKFQLIGHYTRQCEDSYHSSLWVQLSDLARLELTLAPVNQSRNLKDLPAPFFDRREQTQQTVPFVFADKPAMGSLQAAGVAASWFGMQAPDRGVQFPVTLGSLPQGHAVVFLQGNESVAGLRANPNASLSLIPHPGNPAARLLLVSGNDAADLMRAARALALGSAELAGNYATIGKDKEPAARQPYDAPAWVPSSRPVRLGELTSPQNLQVHAYYPDPLRVNLRIAPDTFVWRTEGIPLDLRFRAVRLPQQRNASLNLSLDGSFVQSFALDPAGPATAPGANGLHRELVRLPASGLQGRNQLQMTYYFDVLRQGECLELPPNNLEGSIEPDSTLDLSSFPHYAAMPNLAYFASMGYPYTRLADLSETAVVIPDAPNSYELGLYFNVMGRMGESTGYPAIRHALVPLSAIDSASSKDLIVIQSAASQSLMSKWKDALPMVVVNGEREVREPRSGFRLRYQWAQEDLLRSPSPAGSLRLSSSEGISAIMGFESPLSSGRSVVLFYADRAEQLRKISDVMIDFDRLPSVQGDFVVVDDKSIQHARASETYHVGSLPLLSRLRWLLADQPVIFALLAVLLALALGLLAYQPLRRMAARAKR